MTVVNLTKLRLEPVPVVVSELEILLERAKTGENRGYAIAVGCDARSTATDFQIGDTTIPDLVCALEYLKLRLLKEGEDDG